MKKSLFILPLAAMALAACDLSAITDLIPFWPKGDTSQSSQKSSSSSSKSSSSSSKSSGSSTSSKSSGSSSSTSGSEQKSHLQKAYEAAMNLESEQVTSDSYTFEGVITGTAGNTFYVQEGEYAMQVYNYKLSGVAVGKRVSVTATLTNYKGTPETKTVSAASILGDGAVSAAVVSSVSELEALKVNALTSVTDLVFVEEKTEWKPKEGSEKGKAGIYKFTLNGEDISVKCNIYSYSTEAYNAFHNAEPDQKFSLSNLVKTVYNEESEFEFIGTSSIN